MKQHGVRSLHRFCCILMSAFRFWFRPFSVRDVRCFWLIKLTFWQQSVLDDASLEQQPRQQQAEGNQDVDEGRRGSAVGPEGSQGSAPRLLLQAIVRRKGAAPFPGTGGQFNAVVCQVSNLSSSPHTKCAIIKMKYTYITEFPTESVGWKGGRGKYSSHMQMIFQLRWINLSRTKDLAMTALLIRPRFRFCLTGGNWKFPKTHSTSCQMCMHMQFNFPQICGGIT